MEAALRTCCKGIKIGKILVVRHKGHSSSPKAQSPVTPSDDGPSTSPPAAAAGSGRQTPQHRRSSSGMNGAEGPPLISREPSNNRVPNGDSAAAAAAAAGVLDSSSSSSRRGSEAGRRLSDAQGCDFATSHQVRRAPASNPVDGVFDADEKDKDT